MRRGIGLLLAMMRSGLLLAIASCPAFGAAYRVGVEDVDNLPMYGMHNGNFAGFGRAILDAFAEKSGHRFVYIALPIRRLHEAFLVDATVDFKFPDHAAWQPDMRKGLSIAYSDPVMYVTGGMAVRADKVGRPLKELRTIGIVMGFTPHILKEKLASLRVVENASMQALLAQVQLGRLDAALINVDRYAPAFAPGGPFHGALAFDPGLPHERSAMHFSTRQHGQVILDFNAFLKAETALIGRLRKLYKLSP